MNSPWSRRGATVVSLLCQSGFTVDGDDKDATHGKTLVVDGDVICYVFQHGTMECI